MTARGDAQSLVSFALTCEPCFETAWLDQRLADLGSQHAHFLSEDIDVLCIGRQQLITFEGR